MNEPKPQAPWLVALGVVEADAEVDGDFSTIIDTYGFDNEARARQCAENWAVGRPNAVISVYKMKAFVVATQPAPKVEWCNKVGER